MRHHFSFHRLARPSEIHEHIHELLHQVTENNASYCKLNIYFKVIRQLTESVQRLQKQCLEICSIGIKLPMSAVLLQHTFIAPGHGNHYFTCPLKIDKGAAFGTVTISASAI